ncbi:unnamed protein product [Sordaria macrospora k-hell]|uniref:WGS project CABT00000000 data, contig 2.1 n=1 Tax=Sordaria macrospora (strain ATCC MYA-333 / DSM 997 / K(L3346) / K-hell) TaxID=771870 RepID=F7VKX7_SORMK|nr:uncharacterized protein SMAC_00372 [Sordaria macrospora k-hell]CCC06154.1 unnamed protein product [Sordaria macrospora k-hell]
MNYLQLTQTLTESFIALADEVQSLIDRKTILEHKLRFAHEQYQCLADKYAPAVPEVAETLAKLQLPPDVHYYSVPTNSSVVPLPQRIQPGNSQHEIALQIREGRKAAQLIAAAMGRASKHSDSSKEEASTSPVTAADTMTTMSTVLEKDFTVEGKKKGLLACPFSVAAAAAAAATPPAVQDQASPNLGIGSGVTGDGAQDQDAAAVAAAALNEGAGAAAMDPTPHKSSDPICAAMYEDSTSMPAHTAASKCPIRFLDQHSPEEIARYVETHKHEIPRSHEVCVRRYQKNEEQVRKLDAKYGNLVNMIEDLSHLHKPMLPSPLLATGGDQYQDPEQVDRSSNDRVANWAKSVSASDPQAPPETQDDDQNLPPVEDEEEREGRFDRPLREVRLGESPSRPWGIPVPAMEDQPRRQRSRSPSPVRPVVSSSPPAQDEIPSHKKGPGLGSVPSIIPRWLHSLHLTQRLNHPSRKRCREIWRKRRVPGLGNVPLIPPRWLHLLHPAQRLSTTRPSRKQHQERLYTTRRRITRSNLPSRSRSIIIIYHNLCPHHNQHSSTWQISRFRRLRQQQVRNNRPPWFSTSMVRSSSDILWNKLFSLCSNFNRAAAASKQSRAGTSGPEGERASSLFSCICSLCHVI